MEARAGATALRAVRLSAYTEALSLKDYEGLAASLESDSKRLVAVRALLKKRLTVAPLFDTRRWASSFSDALHASYESFLHGNAHVVVKDAQKSSKFDIDDVHAGNESRDTTANTWPNPWPVAQCPHCTR